MSEELDLSKCKVGDKVKLRNGYVVKIVEIDHNDAYPIKCDDGYVRTFCGSMGKIGGRFYGDIVSIVNEPAQKDHSEKTLRDEFAMAAIQGLLSDNDVSFETNKEIATACYALADAMMKARDEK